MDMSKLLDLAPSSPRKHRLAAVRDMARQLRNFFGSTRTNRFYEFEALIKQQERRHRKGYPGGYAESVAVAADYFVVKCFADAFEVFEKNDGVAPAKALTVRTDYLLAIALVAEFSLYNPLVLVLSNMDERRTIEQSVDLGELKHAATLLDYSDDIARR